MQCYFVQPLGNSFPWHAAAQPLARQPVGFGVFEAQRHDWLRFYIVIFSIETAALISPSEAKIPGFRT